MTTYKVDEVPKITEESVSNLILSTSNMKRGTKGDIPPKLMNVSLPATKGVITSLFDKVACTGKWPEMEFLCFEKDTKP